MTDEQAKRYHDLVQIKALPELSEFVASLAVDSSMSKMLLALPRLNGSVAVLAAAGEVLGLASSEVKQALAYLVKLAAIMKKRYPQVDLYIDLAELRGANYHTGVVFSVLSPDFAQAVSKGGRYDDIGKDFGRPRPATGFSTDLVTLCDISENIDARLGVLAPVGEEASLLKAIAGLRAQGVRVIQRLPADDYEATLHCDRELVKQADSWGIVPRDHNLKLKN